MYYFWVIVVAIGLLSHLVPYLLNFQIHDRKFWTRLQFTQLANRFFFKMYSRLFEAGQKLFSGPFEGDQKLFSTHVRHFLV